MDRRSFLKSGASVALGAGVLPYLKFIPANAQAAETLVVVTGETINSLDLHRTGTNRASYQVAVNCYDRLVSFGIKENEIGELSYDYDTIVPELAESWEFVDDGMAILFKLKENAKFWDGTPVTAEDVKWSFDRAVSVGGFSGVQMKAGGLETTDQFEVIDTYLFKVKMLQPSKLTLPNLAVPVPFVINSKAAIANATDADPWAMEYLHRTPAGSGAFKVGRWEQGQQLVYERNDDWVGGELPGVSRVILREVPSASTRRALLERGDVQMSFNMPDKDAAELDSMDGITVNSTPIDNCLHVVGLNTKFAPFQDADVRKAVAYAIPYAEIFAAAAYGRGKPMWDGDGSINPTEWPVAFPYSTDLEKAKEHLAKSSFKDGFDVTLSIDLSHDSWTEPAAILIKESLEKIGINIEIDKIPGANWRTACLVEKRLDMHLENFGGWLNTPCYYFFWAYKDGHLFNSSNYHNEEVERLVDETLHMAMDHPDYIPKVTRMIEIAFEDLPRIPLWQPAHNVGMKGADGYQFWFHRQLDARTLKKA